MAGIGAVIAGAAVSAVGSYAKSRSDKKAAERAQQGQMAMTEEENKWAMQRTAQEFALEDYYKQKDRVEAKRGLDEFRKFSTVNTFAPGYVNSNPGPTLPAMPGGEMPGQDGTGTSRSYSYQGPIGGLEGFMGGVGGSRVSRV